MTDKQTDKAYHEVLALYTALREANDFKVRRAEIRSGETPAQAIDFKCDVEVKASRALLSDPYALALWNNVVREPEQYPRLPELVREVLGKAFAEGDLGQNGAYRSLYARQEKA